MLKSILICVFIFLFTPSLFSQCVDTAWVRRYNGPENSMGNARAITVDGSGNVYVTGYSEGGSGTGNDYATIKYDAAGNQLWVQRYNGSGNADDNATAIALDGSGNVYVTGTSTGSVTGKDYATIKYDSAGKELWVKTYNSPGNADDAAIAMALDGSGNIYVTGNSGGSPIDYWNLDDYATIKYDSAGKELWVRTYNGPGNSGDGASAITVDGSGNVYVTGNSTGSGTDMDYATIKYDQAGKQLWIKRYNGSGNGYDGGTAISVDGSGNVYVTGTSTGSGTLTDYATIKYDQSGKQLWVKTYNGPRNSYDNATAIAVDGSGNVYVTGGSYGSGMNYDYATIKYDSAGNQLWVQRYNGSGNADDNATAIALDGSGNVYVTGQSYGSGTKYDYATIKYDSAGKELWIKTYNNSGKSDDGASAIVVDGSGNVYVTGSSEGSGSSGDYATIKYFQF